VTPTSIYAIFFVEVLTLRKKGQETMVEGRHYLTAREVASTLGVSLETVYAYVSRGKLRPVPESERIGYFRVLAAREGHSEDWLKKQVQKSKLYLAEDVQRLLDRKSYRKDPIPLTNGAIHWGTPVLESALTQITETGLYYRGQDVAKLAAECSIEQVAALLWSGESANETEIFTTQTALPLQHYLDTIKRMGEELAPLQRLQIALALAMKDDLASYDLDTQSLNLMRTGARILKLLVAVATDNSQITGSLAAHLQETWRPDAPATQQLFNAALIASADHELNASSFTARVVASADAQPYLVVTAGLAALQGFKHGGSIMLVESLLREIGTEPLARQVVASRLKRGECIPGFGHRLYANGDPRGAILLHQLEQDYQHHPAMRLIHATIEAVYALTGKRPSLDLGLVALAHVLGLPEGSALTLFALGRTVGWIGHALEQYQTKQIIRPRARYVGV
jgi:citrate synthase